MERDRLDRPGVPIMRYATALAGLSAALLLALGGQAQAHAHLVKAEPAVDAMGAAPKEIVLHFNEKLVAGFSGFDLTGPKGAKIAVTIRPGADGVSLIGAPASALTPGAYKVTWHAVTADTHRTQGVFGFMVH
jgi:methionine-rich copper-binding protein CopC